VAINHTQGKSRRYCRINRIYRDIPSTNIVAGSKMTNMRQHLHGMMRERGVRCRCIRCREMRNTLWTRVDARDQAYRTTTSEERFLSYVDPDDKLAGYLRLSLPDRPGFAGDRDLGMPELREAALVREVHVYGPVRVLGRRDDDGTQHSGLGTRLIEEGEALARGRGFAAMAIIAAVGTRSYYAARGYAPAGTSMRKRFR